MYGALLHPSVHGQLAASANRWQKVSRTRLPEYAYCSSWTASLAGALHGRLHGIHLS